MIKLQILSDIHTEFLHGRCEDTEKFYASLIPNKDIDILIIAGDLGAPLDALKFWKREEYESTLQFFNNCECYKHIFLIPGNHDFYHGSFDRYRRFIKRQKLDKLSVQSSQNGLASLQIGGRTIWGCTLWFPNRPENTLYFSGMNDMHNIEDSLRQIETTGKRQVELLLKSVKPGDIIVTHHAPTSSIRSRYSGSDTPLQRFYYNELAEQVITDCNPELWIFGHTHISEDRILGDTRVVSNPAGYYGHGNGHMSVQNEDFIPQLIVEIGD